MKTIQNIFIALMMFLITTSCNKFLELKPRDVKIVTSIEDYRDMMASYMYYLKDASKRQVKIFGADYYAYPNWNYFGTFAVYTGEVTFNVDAPNNYDKNKSEYTLTGVNTLTWLNANETMWNQFYTFLGPLNYIISEIDDADGDNEDLRHYVKGEALLWRAYSHFKLLQYYAPYKDNNYGIAMNLRPQDDIGTVMPERYKQSVVYKQIIDDCLEVLDLLKLTPTNDWNFAYGNGFANALLASVYHYKAESGAAEATDWENANKYATEAMIGRNLAKTKEELKMVFNFTGSGGGVDYRHNEFYFRIIEYKNNMVCDLVGAYKKGSWSNGEIVQEYYNLYSDDDIRKVVFFDEDGEVFDKYSQKSESFSGGCVIPCRLAEMYLIKAEALINLNKLGEAQAIMQEFKDARYTATQTVSGDAQQLYGDIMQERRKEFYLENDFRWLDMKRQEISMQRIVNGVRVTLASDDFRYCFPIPKVELEKNKKMVQNPGWANIRY